MFFTSVARVVAVLMFIGGAFRLADGLYVASIDDAAQRAAYAARYLGHGSSGEAIDGGLNTLMMALALGVLVEISRSLLRMQEDKAANTK